MKQTNTEEKVAKARNNQQDYITAVGRRREAVARVRLYSVVKDTFKWGEVPFKKGDILVNQKPIDQYFTNKVDQIIYKEPLRVTNAFNRYAFTILVTGGGKSGQLNAVVHGIARALVKADKAKYRPILKKRGFLTRDARVRERRKVGTGGKARREKQSPKR